MTDTSKEPKTYKDALASSDGTKWQKAMATEIESLGANDVWDLVELPRDRKAVGSKWVFKLKVAADGSVDRYKARLVAQGFSQKFGVDYDETFCPVVRPESVRTVIALAAENDLKLHQMDVTTAFLNGELKEVVYMKQPEGFIEEGQEHLVCRLKRSIYGLKQSPRCWNSALDVQLKEMGFAKSTSDPCVYMSTEGEMFVIAVYVDDIVLAGKTDERIAEVKKALSERFKVKDMGNLHYFLGVKVAQNYDTGETWIGQGLYTESILRKFGMEDSKPVNTPVDTSTKLVTATEDCETIDTIPYERNCKQVTCAHSTCTFFTSLSARGVNVRAFARLCAGRRGGLEGERRCCWRSEVYRLAEVNVPVAKRVVVKRETEKPETKRNETETASPRQVKGHRAACAQLTLMTPKSRGLQNPQQSWNW